MFLVFVSRQTFLFFTDHYTWWWRVLVFGFFPSLVWWFGGVWRWKSCRCLLCVFRSFVCLGYSLFSMADFEGASYFLKGWTCIGGVGILDVHDFIQHTSLQWDVFFLDTTLFFSLFFFSPSPQLCVPGWEKPQGFHYTHVNVEAVTKYLHSTPSSGKGSCSETRSQYLTE